MRHKIKKTKETKRFSDVKLLLLRQRFIKMFTFSDSRICLKLTTIQKKKLDGINQQEDSGTQTRKRNIREWVQTRIKPSINAGKEEIFSHNF